MRSRRLQRGRGSGLAWSQGLAQYSGVGRLRVRLFGAFEIEGVESQRLGSRKARTLLKILALARGKPVVAGDCLVERLWPDALPAKPATQVAVLVSRLRAELGPDRLVRTDAGYPSSPTGSTSTQWPNSAKEAARRLATGSRRLRGLPLRQHWHSFAARSSKTSLTPCGPSPSGREQPDW